MIGKNDEISFERGAFAKWLTEVAYVAAFSGITPWTCQGVRVPNRTGRFIGSRHKSRGKIRLAHHNFVILVPRRTSRRISLFLSPSTRNERSRAPTAVLNDGPPPVLVSRTRTHAYAYAEHSMLTLTLTVMVARCIRRLFVPAAPSRILYTLLFRIMSVIRISIPSPAIDQRHSSVWIKILNLLRKGNRIRKNTYKFTAVVWLYPAILSRGKSFTIRQSGIRFDLLDCLFSFQLAPNITSIFNCEKCEWNEQIC